MKNINLLITLIILVSIPLNLSAQDKLKGNKIVTSENRYIDNFNKIEVNDKMDIILTQGMEQSVTVEADENLHVAILTEVRDSTLIISLTKRIVRKKALIVHVVIDNYIDEITSKDKSDIKSTSTLKFNQLTINSDGDSKLNLDIHASKFVLNNNESANVKLTVNADDIYINADKSGKAKINVSCNHIEANTQGSSTTNISGTCTELYVNAENKSDFKGEGLESKDVIIDVSDSADVQVNAKTTILISAIDNSEIHIYNNPSITIEKFTDKAILRKK